MSVFAILAKVKLDIDSIKCPNFVAIRHTIGFLDSGCISMSNTRTAQSAVKNLDCRPKKMMKRKLLEKS
jgi:hypothetical protein